MRKRIALVAATALVLVGVVGGAVAYSAGNKTVTLSVDGRAQQVVTRAATVADVLAAQGIETGRHDAVAPSPDSTVDDGTRIAVRFGRPLDLTVDGDGQTYWVTATSVDSALDQLGLRFSDADLSASRSAPIGRAGLDLTVRTEKRITLVAGGRKARKVTTAVTVGQALQDLKVGVDKDDEVRPRTTSPIDDGSRVHVVRIEQQTRKVEVEVPNETVVTYDDSMLEGRERVRRPGRDGLRVDTYKVVLADGEQRSRKRVGSTVRTTPVDRVEVHGTKEPPTPEPEPADTTTGLSAAPCPSGSDVEDGLSANAVAVHRAVCAQFPEVGSYGGLRPGDSGEHGEGRALDIMVSDSSLGDAIADWVRANAGSLGVSEILWSQQIWTVERGSEGWRSMEDMGSATANHYDHVHVTVY
ncbi:MAG TPA: ubiquitin-like domain-containing protein [Nocardioidaceae bacterium]|nr:ubiquitin-like domain-containing protein [Nocardioidaceae bacterium]